MGKDNMNKAMKIYRESNDNIFKSMQSNNNNAASASNMNGS
jgi:hypothetical protein